MQLDTFLRLTDIEVVKHLFIYFIILAAIIFGLVVFFVMFYSRKYSVSKVSGTPEQNHGNRKFEIFILAVAVGVTAFFLVLTLHAMQEIQTIPENPVPDIEITGHQWWWEAKYPDGNVVTANEIHIPVGKKVMLQLTSGDVIHSWWVPALGRKMDMIPGLTNYMWFTASEPGEYLGSCSEFCGMQHARMRIRVIAQSQTDFDNWKAEQLKPAIAANTAEEIMGKRLFEQKTCASCIILRVPVPMAA